VSTARLYTPSVVLSAGATKEEGEAVVPSILARRKGFKCWTIAGHKWCHCVYGLPQGLILWRPDLLGRRLGSCCAYMIEDARLGWLYSVHKYSAPLLDDKRGT
jgi:hypothetical protein